MTFNKRKRTQNHTAKPMDPIPKMATVDPFSTFAVLHAAPTPETKHLTRIK